VTDWQNARLSRMAVTEGAISTIKAMIVSGELKP